MKSSVEVCEIDRNQSELCNRILRSLPDWFGIEDAIVKYVEDVATMPMFVAHLPEHGEVGFLSLNFHNPYHAEIHVMGVLKDFQGHGIGKTLVKAAESHSSGRNANYITVKTLSPSRPDPNYDLTRKFYESVGFRPLEEFKTLWGEGNPCLLMIKTLIYP